MVTTQIPRNKQIKSHFGVLTASVYITVNQNRGKKKFCKVFLFKETTQQSSERRLKAFRPLFQVERGVRLLAEFRRANRCHHWLFYIQSSARAFQKTLGHEF